MLYIKIYRDTTDITMYIMMLWIMMLWIDIITYHAGCGYKSNHELDKNEDNNLDHNTKTEGTPILSLASLSGPLNIVHKGVVITL